MRVLMTCGNRAEVGTFIRLLRYGAALAARGHVVTLIRQGEQLLLPSVEARDDMTILVMPRFGFDRWLPRTIRPNDIAFRLAHVLTHVYDVHHAFQEFESVALPWWLSRRLRRAKLHLYDADDLWVDGGYLQHEADHRGIWRWHYRNVARIERSTRKAADGMTVVNEFLRDRAIALGMPAERILLLRPGIALTAQPLLPKAQARARLQLPSDVPILAFTGFGQQDVIEALEICTLLKTRGATCHFLLIGPAIGDLRQQIQAAQMENCVTVTGTMPPSDVAHCLAAADVALLPYPDTTINRSRWPTKISDYLAAGLPTLAGPAGSVGAELRELGAGDCYRDAGEAAAILQHWLANPAHRERMHNHARAGAQARYDINRQAEHLETFYRTLQPR